jgi:uncharacterized protein YlaI
MVGVVEFLESQEIGNSRKLIDSPIDTYLCNEWLGLFPLHGAGD